MRPGEKPFRGLKPNDVSTVTTGYKTKNDVMTTKISISNVQVMGHAFQYFKRDTHPLIRTLSEVSRKNPVMNYLLEEPFNRYLLKQSKVVAFYKKRTTNNTSNCGSLSYTPANGSNSQQQRQQILISSRWGCSKTPVVNTLKPNNLHDLSNLPSCFDSEPLLPFPCKRVYQDVMRWGAKKYNGSRKRFFHVFKNRNLSQEKMKKAKFNSMYKNQLSRMNTGDILTRGNVSTILNWLSLLHLYVTDKGYKLEQFQKTMIAHCLVFTAASIAPCEMHLLVRILMMFCGLVDVYDTKQFIAKLREYRRQVGIFIVPRRMGKTFTLSMLMASCALVTKQRIGYFAHQHSLCKTVKDDLAKVIGEMTKIINSLHDNDRNRFPVLDLSSGTTRISVNKNSEVLTLKFKYGSESVQITFRSMANDSQVSSSYAVL